MRLVIKDKNKVRINRFVDWCLYMIGYTLVFFLVTSLFKEIVVDTSYYYLWYFLVVLILYALNKTIKPILVTLTIPITGITLGLFYPCINAFILKLTDWILGSHFDIKSIWVLLLAAILIAVMNFIMEKIIKHMIGMVHNNG